MQTKFQDQGAYCFRNTASRFFFFWEKIFREMKKDVGMTTAQKSKETRRMDMGSVFVLYIQLMCVYVGIVGWIYRTKIHKMFSLIITDSLSSDHWDRNWWQGSQLHDTSPHHTER